MNTLKPSTEKLISLNRIEVVLGVIVALMSLVGAIGSWMVLPYRMTQAEGSMKELRQEVANLKIDTNTNRELLIRIDERLRQVQRALKIPTNEP